MKVVVLDNDAGMRELMVLALGRRGIQAAPASTVEEAEAGLSGADGLLMDFHLGGGNSGADVVRRWSGEGRLPRFWLVTGTPEEPEAQALGELRELVRVVGKPFRLLPFAEEVEQILAQTAADGPTQVLENNDLAPESGPNPQPGEPAPPNPLQDPDIEPDDPQPSGPGSED